MVIQGFRQNCLDVSRLCAQRQQQRVVCKMSWNDIPGWLTDIEGEALQRLAEARLVLEIGSLFGRSTVCMAKHATHIVSVDPHDGRAIEGTKWENQNTLATFMENLTIHDVRSVVTPIVTTSDQASRWLPPTFELIFVDGDHSHAACLHDLQLAKLLSKNVQRPIIAVHDFGTGYKQLQGVTSAVREFVSANRLASLHRVASLAIITYENQVT